LDTLSHEFLAVSRKIAFFVDSLTKEIRQKSTQGYLYCSAERLFEVDEVSTCFLWNLALAIRIVKM